MKALFTPTLLFCAASAPLYGQKMQLEEADRRPEPIIDEATEETALAVNQLQLPEGLEASLWAAEPMLANPVAFAFDGQGRLFVSETYRYRTSTLDIRSYMDMLEEDLAARTVDDRAQLINDLFGDQASQFEIESEVVRLVEDRDGDGSADFSSAYADGFNSALSGIASGVLPWKEDVFFTNIPHLWRLQGLTEEGKAESRESMFRGWGVHFGYTGHDFHGLIVGPDGKLYFSIGDRGMNVVNQEGQRLAYPDMGAVYRCNLDGSELEVVHWGLRNPQELAFDELGNLFTGDNDCDNGDYERLVHVVEGGDSGWRIGHQYAPLGGAGVWMSENWWKTREDNMAEFLLPPLAYIEDGPSGIAYYPGTGLSPDYRGHLFMTHFKGTIATSGVFSYTMKQDGATFALDQKEQFLKGVLPTDVTFGPDGKFYVLDWVEGWPKSNKGRVYALHHADHVDSPLLKETQQLFAEGMEQRSADELAGLLSHPNWDIRLNAQLELAERGESSIATLADVAGDERAELYPRLHATWGLGILADRGSSSAADEVRALASSQADEVRAQAIKLIGDHGIGEEFDLLVSSLQDSSPRVRFFAAQSLGKLGRPAAAPHLIELARANDDADLYLRHAIVMGLAGSKNRSTLAKAAKDDSVAVRTAALLAYRRLGDPKIAVFLDDPEKKLVFEAARAINDEPIEAAYPALAAKATHAWASDPILGQRALNAHFRAGKPANAKALAQYAVNNDMPEELRIEALKYLADWPSPHDRDRVLGVYRPLQDRNGQVAAKALASVTGEIFRTATGAVQAETIAAANTLGMETIKDQLYALVADESREGAARLAAFNALQEQNDPRMDELVTIASRSNASELRLGVLPLVAERSPEEVEATLSLMVEGSYEEQRAAYGILAKTDQPFAARLLAESLERLARNEVPYAAQLELLEAAENSRQPQVQEAYQAYQAAVAEDPDPIAGYRFALEGGEERRGYRVYFNNPTMACVRCHVVFGPGESAGPNLSDVGLRYDRPYLLEAVVAPSATIAPGFDNVIVTLKDGSSVAGIVQSDSEERLTLKKPDGSLVVLEKADVAKRDSMPSSMPEIYGPLLERSELRDVVAFLASLKTDPHARGTHGE